LTDAGDHRPKLGPNDWVIDEAFALRVLPHRGFGAHKWGVGGLVVVAGAPGYVGAPVLCGQAAARAGAGIVNLAVPRALISAIAAYAPEIAYVPLPGDDSGAGLRRAVEAIGEKLERSRAAVIGPGLGNDEAATALLSALFNRGPVTTPIGFGRSHAQPGPSGAAAGAPFGGKHLVIDADGLNWLARQDKWWEWLEPGQAVLTPHPGEMARLRGQEPRQVIADPLKTVREAARVWNQVVVFKYGYTAVSDGRQTAVSPEAPASLATAGSGDVFAGSIGAFLAQGLSPFDAAALAIYVGCRAARRVERRVGTLGLIATDLPLAIAEETAALERAREGVHA